MHDLVYGLKRLAERNRDGSLKTQYDRRKMLMLCGAQLVEMGYKQLAVEEVKGRHVHKLVARWQGEGLSSGTIENRLAVLRWWCEKVGKGGVMGKRNAAYGVEPRQRVSEDSKGKVLTEAQLAQIPDAHIQMSLRLIVAWGLRRKEGLLLRPHQADGGDHLSIQGNWAKNGRPRTIALSFREQREVLDAAKVLVQQTHSSMIPDHLTYIVQRHKFDYWVQQIGLGGGHGLRHTWAHRRYAQLAGFPCPHAGGPVWEGMTEAQRQADVKARQQVSEEMGHNGRSITSVYLGDSHGVVAASGSTER